MKCFKCKSKKGTILLPSLNKLACERCFVRIIEKRFSKTIKELGFKDNIKIALMKPSDEVLVYLFKKKGFSVEIINKPVINQLTLDELAINIIKSFNDNSKKIIDIKSPFESISEKELIDYSKIEGLSFKGNNYSGADKVIYDFLMNFDKRRSGVLYSVKNFIKAISSDQ